VHTSPGFLLLNHHCLLCPHSRPWTDTYRALPASSKPSPDIYNLACGTLGAKKEDVVVIEDDQVSRSPPHQEKGPPRLLRT
jgi:hypothetical protein